MRFLYLVLAVLLLLLVPFIAMQFTDGVRWSLWDFVVMGILLLLTGFTCDLLWRKVPKMEHRITLCVGLVIAHLLVWAQLAVGIFGTPLSGS